MKTIARIVTRFQGKGDGLFLGSLMRDGEGVLKPNTIYEIQDIMGVLTIVEKGRATGAGDDNCSSKRRDEKVQFHWSNAIGYIIDTCGKHLFLTEEEYEQSQAPYRRDFEQ